MTSQVKQNLGVRNTFQPLLLTVSRLRTVTMTIYAHS